MKPTISGLFWYQMRAKRRNSSGKMEPLVDSNGTQVLNDNYISFVSVISAFWEMVEQHDGTFKPMLNVFLPGGSVKPDGTSRSGYTVIFNEILGTKFITQWYNWSCAFGLAPTAPQATTQRIEGNEVRPRSHNRAARFNDDDFVDPDAPTQTAAAVIED